METAKQMTSAKSEEESDSDTELDVGLDGSDNENHFENIRFYMGLLMSLVPSMDRLYQNLDRERYTSTRTGHSASAIEGLSHDDVNSKLPQEYPAIDFESIEPPPYNSEIESKKSRYSLGAAPQSMCSLILIVKRQAYKIFSSNHG